MAKPAQKQTSSKTGPRKEFAPSFGLWPTKKGTGYGAFIDAKLLDTLAKAQEGGRLFLSEVPEDAREENDKLPTYRVAILNPDEETRPASSDEI